MKHDHLFSASGRSFPLPEDRATEPEAAVILGLATPTLRSERVRNRHKIPFWRIGRKIAYSRRELHAWLAANATVGGALTSQEAKS